MQDSLKLGIGGMKKARGQQSPATVRAKSNNRGRHEFKGENVFEFRS
jgi:hypothetical protein